MIGGRLTARSRTRCRRLLREAGRNQRKHTCEKRKPNLQAEIHHYNVTGASKATVLKGGYGSVRRAGFPLFDL